MIGGDRCHSSTEGRVVMGSSFVEFSGCFDASSFGNGGLIEAGLGPFYTLHSTFCNNKKILLSFHIHVTSSCTHSSTRLERKKTSSTL